MKYSWWDDGEKINDEGRRPDQNIFALYKSMDRKETEKIKNPVMRSVYWMVSGIFCVVGLSSWWFYHAWVAPSKKVSAVAASSPSVKAPGSSPAAVSSVLPVGITHLRLSSIKLLVGRSDVTFLIFNGHPVALSSFPFKESLQIVMGSYYADVPSAAIISEKAEAVSHGNESRTDSASVQPGAAAGAAVSLPSPVASVGKNT